ncbi:hypothetical protein WOSG25_050340 [Weissella oryzae SG25]|uniref:Uncharacterized protein n=1 Tax=Weissella oryzae (strain DSM 25784 / JCM 18191 / LMG 30913 / SG25) TaxID=1329250 RepID=A0A069CTR2_WEIOS|nr:hypothetical protein WOSG25_050340 [Weissella oryzae SG25]
MFKIIFIILYAIIVPFVIWFVAYHNAKVDGELSRSDASILYFLTEMYFLFGIVMVYLLEAGS